MKASTLSLNREILRLALPSILANITIPLVGMVDLAIAGHISPGSGAALIGGISIGTMLFDLVYWNFSFLRVGTGGLTAQSYGKGDRSEMAANLLRGLFLAIVSSILVLILQRPFCSLAFLAVDCTPEVADLARRYFFVRIWAAPATLSLFAFKGWFIGMQDAVSSMATDLVVNLVNILSSILLSMKVGFVGIAYGTLIAQYTGLVFALVRTWSKYGREYFAPMGVDDVKEALRWGKLRSFLSMNVELFIRSMCLLGVYVGFTILSARYGELLLASCSILMKLLLLFSYITDGYAYAAEAMVGKYIGQGNRPQLSASVRWTFIWSMGIALLFVLVYAFWGEGMVSLFTDDEPVIRTCGRYLPWLLAMPLLGCAAFTFDGVFVGATASRALMMSTLWCVAGFFAVWFGGTFILGKVHPVSAAEEWGYVAVDVLFAAYFVHLLVRSLYLGVRYKRDVMGRV